MYNLKLVRRHFLPLQSVQRPLFGIIKSCKYTTKYKRCTRIRSKRITRPVNGSSVVSVRARVFPFISFTFFFILSQSNCIKTSNYQWKLWNVETNVISDIRNESRSLQLRSDDRSSSVSFNLMRLKVSAVFLLRQSWRRVPTNDCQFQFIHFGSVADSKWMKMITKMNAKKNAQFTEFVQFENEKSAHRMQTEAQRIWNQFRFMLCDENDAKPRRRSNRLIESSQGNELDCMACCANALAQANRRTTNGMIDRFVVELSSRMVSKFGCAFCFVYFPFRLFCVGQ